MCLTKWRLEVANNFGNITQFGLKIIGRRERRWRRRVAGWRIS